MKNQGLGALMAVGCATVILFCNNSIFAFQASQHPDLPNLDRRLNDAGAKAVVDRRAPLEKIRGSVPNVRVDFDEVTGSPKWVIAPQGLLTGPDAKNDLGNSPGVPVDEPHRV